MVTEQTERPLPLYVSYATFTTFLDWIAEMAVLPSQIDRSLWSGKFAGGTGSQLVGGLRFLGLLDGETPTPRLEELAGADHARRKELMKSLLRDAYGTDLIDTLPSMTPKMLEEKLTVLGATDATRRKAFSFFVNAVKVAELPIAPGIAKKARNRPTGRKAGTQPRAGGANKTDTVKKPRKSEEMAQDGGSVKMIKLGSGGQVSFGYSIDLFTASQEDREFVLGMIDKLNEYEAGAQPIDADDEVVPELHSDEPTSDVEEEAHSGEGPH